SGAICGVLQFRQQWVSFTGAPQTIAVGADMRLSGAPIGLGLSVISDKIGPMSTTFARVAGSYLIPNLAGGTLGLGLDVGILQKSINSNWVVPEPGKIDPTIPGTYGDALSNPALGKATYDLGFGAFYQIPGRFYAGLSSTHLPAQTVGSGAIKYDMTRHYYVMSGYIFPINPNNEIGVNVKYKSDLAAGAFDANLIYSYLVTPAQKISLGATYRVNDAAAVLLGYQMPYRNYTFKLGYSYDFTLSKIKGYSSGTHELILGVCFTPQIKKISSYGDDRFLN
ncbi:MAG: PorP/SprF family type IX secretion system membrane protein, partial [Bacteroidetes bacterium]|nr:PorP/SprF family type IX secretion system membrane protein [Bacteroidota bacterium]